MITLKTLPQATAQEVFDQCARHLLTQMKRSHDEAECLYRSGDLKCAAGCFISDDDYFLDVEGRPWSDLIEKYDHFPNAHVYLIGLLQDVHDQNLCEEWAQKLQVIATSFKLSPAVLQEFK